MRRVDILWRHSRWVEESTRKCRKTRHGSRVRESTTESQLFSFSPRRWSERSDTEGGEALEPGSPSDGRTENVLKFVQHKRNDNRSKFVQRGTTFTFRKKSLKNREIFYTFLNFKFFNSHSTGGHLSLWKKCSKLILGCGVYTNWQLSKSL